MLRKRISLASWVWMLVIIVTGTALVSPVQAQSIEESKAAVKKMPEDPARHYNLGVAYYKGDKYNEAIASFQEAIRLNEGYKEAYYNMGLAQQKVLKNSAAINSLKKAVELDPDYADAFAALGNAYRASGQHSAAAKSYKSALKIKPDDADWNYNLGIVYQMQEDYENALVAYRDYLKYTPNKTSKRAKQIEGIIKQIEDSLK